jgi:rhomboid protease GluP
MTDESQGPDDGSAGLAPEPARTLRLPMTFVLMAVNVAIYAVMAWKNGGPSFSAEFAVNWGADYTPYTLGDGQVWRLLTSTFLHFSLTHIASNMLCLFYWGLVTERALGSWRWLVAYLAAGVIASTASTLIQHDIVSAGASGSIAGLLGVMTAMYFKRYPGVSAQLIVQNLVLNVIVAFVVQVDWIAHLAGFLAGVAIGMLWLRPRALAL